MSSSATTTAASALFSEIAIHLSGHFVTEWLADAT
jgi:hypothetical protein